MCIFYDEKASIFSKVNKPSLWSKIISPSKGIGSEKKKKNQSENLVTRFGLFSFSF